MTGYKHTESTINKIKTGIKLFRESNPNHFETFRQTHKESLDKINISSLTKGSDKFQNAMANRIGHSDKSKQKIRDTLKEYYKNNKQTPHTVNTLTTNKAIIQYDTDNNMVKEYISIAEAGRTSGVKKANIQHVLCGNTKSAGGFIWKYKSISDPKSKSI